ncbi:MAG: pyridoxal phosphate-dependent aminotransferase [Oscillospiraceae bacterium]|nr:pyridoxal phosphate-dependent aminotransferase [Oscillospiraceae bacterium]
MLPQNTIGWGTARSAIRELFEFGNKRRAAIGAENVFDFSIGNPSIPAPACVDETLRELYSTGDSLLLHSYTSSAGNPSLRKKVAEFLNSTSKGQFEAEGVYITCGSAAGLASSMNGLLMPGEEVILIAPYFPEYKVFVEGAGGKIVVAQPDENMMLSAENIAKVITEKTKAVIINSPNNPSGVVFTAEKLAEMADVLRAAEKKYGNNIYIVSDEPYRELCYGDAKFAPCQDAYENTIVCYSFSKCLSLPGERIGYLAVDKRAADYEKVFASVAGAARALGYVCAPSSMQFMAEKCIGATSDIAQYEINRDILCSGLQKIGYEFAKPDGAFYLFVKALEPDAQAFSDKAKEFELLLVPSDTFGVGGYVRLSYCVSREMIEKSMPALKKLYDCYKK